MRSLRNLCLAYAHAAGNPRAAIMLKDQYQTANNLTDKLAALQTMVNSQTPAKSDMEVDALKRWYNEPLLINKWLTIQATATSFPGEPLVLERVKELTNCEFFSIKNPNNVYALLCAFSNRIRLNSIWLTARVMNFGKTWFSSSIRSTLRSLPASPARSTTGGAIRRPLPRRCTMLLKPSTPRSLSSRLMWPRLSKRR